MQDDSAFEACIDWWVNAQQFWKLKCHDTSFEDSRIGDKFARIISNAKFIVEKSSSVVNIKTEHIFFLFCLFSLPMFIGWLHAGPLQPGRQDPQLYPA